MNVACNRLIGLGGKDEGKGPWLVDVDDMTGRLKGFSPLDGTETPFTQWLGGTIVISLMNYIEPSAACLPLSQWVALLATSHEGADTHQAYAWHLPACLPDVPISSPRLIGND